MMGEREPYEPILNDLIENELVSKEGGILALTEKGINEKDRLSILAGLMVEKDYIAHRPKIECK